MEADVQTHAGLNSSWSHVNDPLEISGPVFSVKLLSALNLKFFFIWLAAHVGSRKGTSSNI